MGTIIRGEDPVDLHSILGAQGAWTIHQYLIGCFGGNQRTQWATDKKQRVNPCKWGSSDINDLLHLKDMHSLLLNRWETRILIHDIKGLHYALHHRMPYCQPWKLHKRMQGPWMVYAFCLPIRKASKACKAHCFYPAYLNTKQLHLWNKALNYITSSAQPIAAISGWMTSMVPGVGRVWQHDTQKESQVNLKIIHQKA